MKQGELMYMVEEILKEANAGILSTIDEKGKARMRWMTPVLLPGRKDAVYSVTAKNSEKVNHITRNPEVEWMIQTRSLDKIITLRGKVSVLEHPSLKNEILEAVGNRLTMFWKINEDLDDFVVLETQIDSGGLFLPMKPANYRIDFDG
jgi:general stress protein 26